MPSLATALMSLPPLHPLLSISIDNPRPHTTICFHLANGGISTCFFSSRKNLRKVLLNPILRSSLSTQTQTQIKNQIKEDITFIAEYLVSSFGFSLDRALKVSTDSHLAAIKSPDQLDAVVKFLNDIGLSSSEIKSVVSLRPVLLGFDVDKTLKPKVSELINAGLSREILVQLIRDHPTILVRREIVCRICFWIDFVGNNDQALLRIIKRRSALISYDIDKQIVPKINLLNEYGMSNSDIVSLLQHGTRFMSQKLDSLRRTLELIEELGIPKGSRKFRSALKGVGGISEDTIKKKVEFFKTYGWSQEDVCSAFRRTPCILSFSEENLKSKMDFLIQKAGVEPKSIISYPLIFGYSLERVVMARYNVLTALKAKGLKTKNKLLSACHMSEKRFYENYVVPFEKDVPGLSQAYVAARDGKGQDCR